MLRSADFPLLIPAPLAAGFPTRVRKEWSQLDLHEQAIFLEEYQQQTKSTGRAYLWWLAFGLHYAYVGQWHRQLLFWGTLGGFGGWALLDLFRLPRLIRAYNQAKARQILQQLTGTSQVIRGNPIGLAAARAGVYRSPTGEPAHADGAA